MYFHFRRITAVQQKVDALVENIDNRFNIIQSLLTQTLNGIGSLQQQQQQQQPMQEQMQIQVQQQQIEQALQEQQIQIHEQEVQLQQQMHEQLHINHQLPANYLDFQPTNHLQPTNHVHPPLSIASRKASLTDQVLGLLRGYVSRHAEHLPPFEQVLGIVEEASKRHLLAVHLFQVLFTKVEIQNTWYGDHSKEHAPLPQQRLNTIQDICFLIFPEDTLKQAKEWTAVMKHIKSRCRVSRSRNNKTDK